MDEIINVFDEIKNKKWIEGIRNGNSSVGVTFESLLGIKENSNPKADFNGIELKTKFSTKFGDISLFSCLPFNYNDIDDFQNMVGKKDKDIPTAKILQFSINFKSKIMIDKNHFIKLYYDKNFGKISVEIRNKETNALINEIFWLTEQLTERLIEKCSNMVFINARKKIKNGKAYFNYYHLRAYKLKSVETFYELLENGIITITFNIGVHKSGELYGLPYYHGITFRINENKLNLLFDKIYDIN